MRNAYPTWLTLTWAACGFLILFAETALRGTAAILCLGGAIGWVAVTASLFRRGR